MTQTTTTPTEDVNNPEIKPLTNSKGEPINEDGTPREETKDGGADAETLESLQKQLKDTKAALTKAQQGKAEEDPKEEEGLEIKQEKESQLQLDEGAAAAQAAGVDIEAVGTEYREKGELSEDTYKMLEEKGFDKATVDGYFEGQKAVAKLQQDEVMETVGGAEKFQELQTWAAEHLSEEEIEVYNQAVVSSNAAAKMAVQAIQAKYVQANGQAPQLITSEGASTGAGDVFQSKFEMTKAMEDTRYWNDPDYQKEVTEKVKRSKAAGKF